MLHDNQEAPDLYAPATWFDHGVLDRTLNRACETAWLDDDEAAEYQRGYASAE